jgi:DNA-binding transcriptional regulator YhcF (GntR family)
VGVIAVIIITNTSGKPIYEQIEEQIKEAILSGDMNEGDMLPSIRQHNMNLSTYYDIR